MKIQSFFSFLSEVSKIVVITLIVVIPIRYLVFQPFIIRGPSMEPNFYNNDYLIIDEISYRFRSPQRGEVIVFKNPFSGFPPYIKRIIGLPGETVEMGEGEITIYQEDGQSFLLDESNYLFQLSSGAREIKVTLDDGEYFVLGDNRGSSSDSRIWGPVPKENIIGKAFLRAWPVPAFAKVETPAY